MECLLPFYRTLNQLSAQQREELLNAHNPEARDTEEPPSADSRDPDDFLAWIAPPDRDVLRELFHASARDKGRSAEEVLQSVVTACNSRMSSRGVHGRAIQADYRAALDAIREHRETALDLCETLLGHKAAAFPVDALPAPIARYVTEAAQAMGCPPDLIGVPALTGLSVAIGTTRRIQIKPGWEEGPRLYTAIVADPGSLKTPATEVALQPLKQRQRQLLEAYQRDKERYQEEIKRYNETKSKDGKSATDAGEPPEEPVLAQVYTTDATMEALAVLLNQNPRGMLFMRDELAGWARAMDKYTGKGDDRQKWLSFWSGGDEIVNRKGRKEPIVLNDPFISVTGCLPPDVLGDLADDRGREDGFVHRILFAYPDPMPRQWADDSVCPETRDAYQRVWEQLWKLEPTLNTRGEKVPLVVTFTPEGQAEFIRWYNDHSAESKDPLFPDNLRGPWAKMYGYCGRLTLIIQECRYVSGEAAGEQIDRISVQGAIRLIDYFKAHARRVYRRLHVTKDDQQLELLLRWIRKQNGPVKLRDLLRANAGGVKSKAEAMRLLRELEDRGHGTLEEGERKETLLFRLHPP